MHRFIILILLCFLFHFIFLCHGITYAQFIDQKFLTTPSTSVKKNEKVKAGHSAGNSIKVESKTEDLKSEIEKLKKRVEELEQKLKEQEEKKKQEEEQKVQMETPATPEPASPVIKAAASRTIFNPETSVVGDFNWLINHDKVRDGGNPFNMKEVELALQSYIDPFSRADIFLSFSRDQAEREHKFEIEEAYATLFKLPFNIQGKIGKFKMEFGKANTMHSHTLETADFPLMTQNFLGTEGISTTGVSLSTLLPFSFSSELILQAGNEENNLSFSGGNSARPLYLARWNNYWDISDDANISLGISYLSGFNDTGGSFLTKIMGGDFILRWKPLKESLYKSFLWRTEYLRSVREASLDSSISHGYYSIAQYQLNRNFYIGGRYDYSEFPNNNKAYETGASLFTNYYPTEFMRYELQYSQIQDPFRNFIPQWWFRMVYILGPHGAHKF
ncbi:MAG: hypothetical protein HYU63_03870 [Armatimonadetes bacterium]|nr:hypothetical protein [Armatimonadota bacterium]